MKSKHFLYFVVGLSFCVYGNSTQVFAKTSWNRQKVEENLTSFVKKEREKAEGLFVVRDDVQNQLRKLALEKIHSDKIVKLSDGTSFVCADFNDANGDKVDVDFFMMPTSRGEVENVTKVQIHKVNGQARYTYVQKNGKWNQVKTN